MIVSGVGGGGGGVGGVLGSGDFLLSRRKKHTGH